MANASAGKLLPPSTITHADCLTKVICIDAKAVRIEFWDSAHYVLPKQSAAVMVKNPYQSARVPRGNGYA